MVIAIVKISIGNSIMIFMTSFCLISVPIKYFIKDITNSKVKETIKAPYRASMSVTLEGGLSRIRGV